MLGPPTNFKYGIASQGVPILGGGGMFTQGNSYFVNALNGSDSYDGKSASRAKATILAAYNLTTSGQNDIVYMLGGTTANTLAASLTWSNSYTHLIGIGAPCHDSQRTRIFHSANFSPMITVSGSGCIFQNLYFSYGDDHADNHILMTLTGSRNYFGNVHFSAMSHQTEADDADSIGIYLNNCQSNLFDHCNFGNQNVARGDANTLLSLNNHVKRVKFEACLFQIWADAATPTFLRTEGTDAFDNLGCWFNDCLFMAQGTTLTQGFDIHAMAQSSTKRRLVAITGASMFVGCTVVADGTGDEFIRTTSYETSAGNTALKAITISA